MRGSSTPSQQGLSSLLCCFSLAIALLGCTPAQTTTAPAVSAPRPGATSPTIPASSTARLTVSGDQVSLDGRPIDKLTPGKFARLDSLFRDLKERPPSKEGYELAVEDATDGAAFKSVLFTSAFAGHPISRLKTADGTLLLRAVVPGPPNAAPPPRPKHAVLLIVRPSLVELWRNHEPELEPIASIQPENIKQALELECHQAPCDRFVLLIANDAKFSTFRTAVPGLLPFTATPGAEVQVRSLEPEPQGSPPKVKLGGSFASGRLPPEVIQRIVRLSWEGMKNCYEAGLARNAHLTGKVVARFVINRDGHVSNVSNGPGTDLPDQEVVACVLKHYYSLTFPQPEDGIVTVVYPVVFEPE